MSLSEWLQNEGAKFPEVAFKRSVDKGIGLFGLKSFYSEPDCDIVYIPSALLLNRSKVLDLAKQTPELKECLDALDAKDMLDERRALMVFLMFLKYGDVGKSEVLGKWKLYVDALPDSLDTPVFFEEGSEEMELLKGTVVESALVPKLAKLHREYDAMKNELSIIDPKRNLVDPKNDKLTLPTFTLDVFKWADGIFWSRVLSFKDAAVAAGCHKKDDFHMVPFVDFANHSESPQLRWRLNVFGNLELYSPDDLNVKSGEELFISYGDKPNAELLFIHGFTLPENIHDAITFPAPILENGDDDEDESVAQIIQAKVSTMKLLGLRPVVRLGHSVANLDQDEKIEDWERAIKELTEGKLDVPSFLTCLVSVVTANDNLIPDIEASGDTVSILVDGKPVLNQQDLWKILSSHPLFDVLLLRVWTVSLNVVESLLGDLVEEIETLEGAEWKRGKGRAGYVREMRRGHAALLMDAMTYFSKLQAEYAEKKSVVEYLSAMNT
ncbi:hypothetical protein HDU97_010221 [Phlyctochytrium planicorne]|nr:hypothetical protein HDU97_010221 [Phlyctochytrium planicorne]